LINLILIKLAILLKIESANKLLVVNSFLAYFYFN